jgi:hypothetical protein
MPAKSREVGNVGWMVRWQTLGADLICKTQSAEMLHGAGLCRIGLRIECCAWLGINDEAGYAAPAQLVGQHQSAGPCACDQDLGIDQSSHALGQGLLDTLGCQWQIPYSPSGGIGKSVGYGSYRRTL